MSGTSRRALLGVGAGTLALAGCAQGDPTAPPSSTPAPTTPAAPSSVASSTAAPATSPAPSSSPSSSLPLADRVGQLFMVGHESAVLSGRLRERIVEHRIGSVLLLGNALGSRQDVVAFASELSGVDVTVPIMLCVDQEGGQVQRLTGDGFSPIPSAREQATLAPAKLQAAWAGWGRELRRAGVVYDLAPVADLVPAARDPASLAAALRTDRRDIDLTGRVRELMGLD